MQIFVTSECPQACARYLDDKRVVKMVLESAQILSTVMHLLGSQRAPYRATHEQHPCVQWAAASYDNFQWLYHHFQELLSEYKARYDKTHACEKHLAVFSQFMDEPCYWLTDKLTPFVNCTLFKDEPDVFTAYRRCLYRKWATAKRLPTWYGKLQR